MPDENKLKKLDEIEYTVEPACATCRYAQFRRGERLFGKCIIHLYTHRKHRDPKARGVSIVASGRCPQHATAFGKMDAILRSGFGRFLTYDKWVADLHDDLKNGD